MVPKRLKSARIRANLNLVELGILAGIDEATAYSRLSLYENGTHRPSFEIVCAFARVLDLPEAYFYTVDDKLAEAVLELYLEHKAHKPLEKKPS